MDYQTNKQINRSIFENFPGEVRFKEPLSKHTTWRVGGPAAAIVFPTDIHSLSKLIRRLREDNVPYCVLGNGSNILAPDEGYRGVIVNLRKGFGHIEKIKESEEDVLLKVGAGVSKYNLLQHAILNGYIDFTFLAGVPGTVGGGLAMNAGTREGTFDAVTESVTLINRNGAITPIEKSELRFSYRSGIRYGVIVESILCSRKGSIAEMKSRMSDFMKIRRKTQPLTFPSCGSTFKNPEGDSAGRLIEEAGLKGLRIGDAQVSRQHANFIINLGKARSKDIEELIHQIKETVNQKFGVYLIEEVQRLGAT
ncbi:UDP-N-acetylmuramate dehydrogenase [Bdellovibrionota bacterium]